MSRSPRAAVVPLDASEVALLRRVAAGDASALGQAFDRYHRDVYAFLSRLRGLRDLDDLVQNVFVSLPAAAARFDGLGSPRAFVFGVALQHARRERRRWFRRFTLWQSRVDEVDPPEAPSDPEQHSIDRQALDRLRRAVAALPEAQRETFLLIEAEGLSGEDAAQALQVPVNTVWTRLHHARRTLRDALRREGAR